MKLAIPGALLGVLAFVSPVLAGPLDVFGLPSSLNADVTRREEGVPCSEAEYETIRLDTWKAMEMVQVARDKGKTDDGPYKALFKSSKNRKKFDKRMELLRYSLHAKVNTEQLFQTYAWHCHTVDCQITPIVDMFSMENTALHYCSGYFSRPFLETKCWKPDVPATRSRVYDEIILYLLAFDGVHKIYAQTPYDMLRLDSKKAFKNAWSYVYYVHMMNNEECYVGTPKASWGGRKAIESGMADEGVKQVVDESDSNVMEEKDLEAEAEVENE